MSDAEWDQWVKRHALTFGLADRQILMLDAWKEVFAVHGYTAAELSRATVALASRPPPGPWEHLAAIHASIREQRAVAYRRSLEAADDRGTCTTCGGTGRVVVPHLRGVVDGEWRPVKAARGGASFYTMAVLCGHCPLGPWFAGRIGQERDGKNRAMLTQPEYEQLNPDWRQQMSRRLREQRASAEAERRPGAVADAFDRALARVQAEVEEVAKTHN